MERKTLGLLAVGMIIGLIFSTLMFGVLYNFSFQDMAYQDCERTLESANQVITYCNEIINLRNSVVGNFHFNTT